MYYTLTKNKKILLISENREKIEEIFHQEGGYVEQCEVEITTFDMVNGVPKIKTSFFHIL